MRSTTAYVGSGDQDLALPRPFDDLDGDSGMLSLSAALQPGVFIGHRRRYRIERLLARGGFGEVYLARDVQLDRSCVVKRLMRNPNWSRRECQWARHSFAREARMLVALNTPGHPHIPEIYEYLPQSHCLVMKFIAGESLDQLLLRRAGPLPEQEALRFVRAACSALVYLHSRSPEPVLHRDLKPANLLLDPEGRIWLIDFGLASSRLLFPASGGAATSQAAGTPGFAAPEQWQGRAEPRSDVYSLGATLYVLLTRRPLDYFSNADGLPPVRQLVPSLSPAVEQLVQRMMARKVDLRPTAAELLADLDALLMGFTIPPPPPLAALPCVSDCVGRAAETAHYSQILARQHSLVITGPAGVGKTTLAALVARQRETVFWHTCQEDEGVEVLIWRLAAFLAHNRQPDVWRMLHGAAGDRPPPAEVLLDYLVQQLRNRGYLLCFDDAHHAGGDSQLGQLLQRLDAAARAGELALLLAARQLASCMRSGSAPPLAGLSLADARELLAKQELVLSAELLETLHAHTEGNPQFLILAAAAARGSDNPEQVIARLDETHDVAFYLMREVDEHLEPEERVLMGALAALLGYPASRDVLEAMLEGGDVPRKLISLTHRHLLRVEDNAGTREYAQHAIVRAFYYQLLGGAERRRLHRQAAGFYESVQPDLLRAARHYQQAGEYERAAQLATADIWAAINQGQARLLGKLLAQCTPQQLEPALWVTVCLAAGEVFTLLGEHKRAAAYYRESLEWLEFEAATPASQVQRARGCRGMAALLEHETPREALAWLRRARAELNGASQLEEAIIELRIGSTLIATGDYPVASQALATSLRLLPDDAASWRARALMSLGVILCSQGQSTGGMHYYRQALAIYQQTGNLWGVVGVQHNMAIEIEIAGDWNAALAHYRQTLELAEQLGSVKYQVELELVIGDLAVKQGDFELAHACLTRSLALARAHGLTEHTIAGLSSMACLHNRQGDHTAALPALHEAEQLAQAIDAHDLVARDLLRHRRG